MFFRIAAGVFCDIFDKPLYGTDFIETEELAVSYESPAVEEPDLVEAAPADIKSDETVESPAPEDKTAAQTFDAGIIAAIAAVVSLAGCTVSKKAKR